MEETIESIIDQTIGFERCIELILVNNGSKDGSDKICRKYQNIYPNNIRCIFLKQNTGPSRARNIGTKYATGEYINYLDSDDKWEKHAFEYAWSFLKSHKDIDILACRERCFDAVDSWNFFDYIFTENQEVIDILNKPECSMCVVHSLIIRRREAEKNSFDEKLSDSEDLKYINQLILNKGKYGILKEAVYYYRVRSDGSSLAQNVRRKYYWYFDVLDNVASALLFLSNKLYGRCIPYLSWLIMCDLQGRTSMELPDYFTEEEITKYRDKMRELLSYINNTIILKQRMLSLEEKINVLYLKYDESFEEHLYFRNNAFWFDEDFLFNIETKEILTFEMLDLQKQKMTLWIKTFCPGLEVGIEGSCGSSYRKTAICERAKVYDRKGASSIPLKYIYRFDIPLEQTGVWSVFIIHRNKKYSVGFKFGSAFPLTYGLQQSHIERYGWICYEEMNKLVVIETNLFHRMEKQISLWWELLNSKKRVALICHIYYYSYRIFSLRKKKIMFYIQPIDVSEWEYCKMYVSNISKKYSLYFVVNTKTFEFEGWYDYLKNYGEIVDSNSRTLKKLYLEANKIVLLRSHFNIINSWRIHEEYIKDILHGKEEVLLV